MNVAFLRKQAVLVVLVTLIASSASAWPGGSARRAASLYFSSQRTYSKMSDAQFEEMLNRLSLGSRPEALKNELDIHTPGPEDLRRVLSIYNERFAVIAAQGYRVVPAGAFFELAFFNAFCDTEVELLGVTAVAFAVQGACILGIRARLIANIAYLEARIREEDAKQVKMSDSKD